MIKDIFNMTIFELGKPVAEKYHTTPCSLSKAKEFVTHVVGMVNILREKWIDGLSG